MRGLYRGCALNYAWVPESGLLLSYSPPEVDRIWLWVYHSKIPTYPIFYLLKGACKALEFKVSWFRLRV